MSELLIANGTIITAAGRARADLLCRDGKIVALAESLPPDGVERLDASGCYILPGGVDAHVHLQMPVGELISSDDFVSGTIAAACGGTTTVIDFATPDRGQPLAEAVSLRRAEADGHVAIDYGLHLALVDATPETLAALPALVQQGYSSIKLYTIYDALYLEDAAILRILSAARQTGALTLIHCENRAIVDHCTRQLLAAAKTAPRYHPRARPAIAETEAVERMLALAEVTGAPLCIAHLSSRRSLEAVRRNRTEKVWVETTPQYLLLTEARYESPGFEGAKYVLTPPLREAADNERLWTALAEGEIDFVSTDHCPWNYLGQKERGRDDFSRIPNGAAGIETRLSLLWSEGVGGGRISAERFVALTATEPARLFGLYPRKGTIAIGADADLVIWDPERRVTLRAEELHQQVDYCPYEGWEVLGYPRDVISRGRIVVRAGQFIGEPGWGRFVPRSNANPNGQQPGAADSPLCD